MAPHLPSMATNILRGGWKVPSPEVGASVSRPQGDKGLPGVLDMQGGSMGVFGPLGGAFPVPPSPEAKAALPVGCQKTTQRCRDLQTGVVSPLRPVPLAVIRLYQSGGTERGRSSPVGCGRRATPAAGMGMSSPGWG